MMSDHELWAIALKVEEKHGEETPKHIATRIGGAAIAGDWAAVEMWRAVANRYDLLHQDARARF